MFQNILSLFRDEEDETSESDATNQSKHDDNPLLPTPDLTVTFHTPEQHDNSDPGSSESSDYDDEEDENRGRYLSTDSQTCKLDKDRWVEDAKKGEFDELILQKRQRRVARDDSNLHLSNVSDSAEKERTGSDSSG